MYCTLVYLINVIFVKKKMTKSSIKPLEFVDRILVYWNERIADQIEISGNLLVNFSC